MKTTRFIKYLSLLLLGIFIIACSKTQKGEEIITDIQFFEKELLPAVDNAKKQCEENLENATQGKQAASGSDFVISKEYGIDIPIDHQPSITDIEKKYGKPDYIRNSIHYFGSFGFQVGNGEDTIKVTKVIVICSKNFKN